MAARADMFDALMLWYWAAEMFILLEYRRELDYLCLWCVSIKADVRWIWCIRFITIYNISVWWIIVLFGWFSGGIIKHIGKHLWKILLIEFPLRIPSFPFLTQSMIINKISTYPIFITRKRIKKLLKFEWVEQTNNQITWKYPKQYQIH